MVRAEMSQWFCALPPMLLPPPTLTQAAEAPEGRGSFSIAFP